MAYYKNGQGGIGLFSWVDDYVLEDMTDYYARKLERCVKCNAVKDGDVCDVVVKIQTSSRGRRRTC